jgi:hypothetical protein
MPDQHDGCVQICQKGRLATMRVSKVRLKLDSPTSRRRQYASVAWLLLLVLGSLWADAKFTLHTYRGENGVRHRVLHVLAFGSTALWFLFLSRNGRQQLLVLLAVLCLGAALELIQSLTYRNVFEWWDVRDDFYGIVVAFMLFWAWSRWRGKQK